MRGGLIVANFGACIACDSLVALPSGSDTGAVIYAKNADRHGSEVQPLAYEPRRTYSRGSTVTLPSGLTIPQVAETYATMGSHNYWGWGYSMGANEFGVAIGNEMFPSHSPSTSKTPLLEFPDIDRLVLERSRNASEAVRVMTDLISSYGQGKCSTCPSLANYNNLFMITDTREAYIAMTVGFEWAYKKVTGDFDTISNVWFLGADHESPGAREVAKQHGWWDGNSSFDFGRVYGTARSPTSTRHERSHGLLNQLRKQGKTITKEHMMHVLGDHGTDPDGDFEDDPRFGHTEIDMHGTPPKPSEITASSLVTDWPAATSSRLPMVWHSLTNPCMSFWYPVFFEGTIPSWLLSYDPWRSFKHVAYGLAGEDLTKIHAVKDAWRPLQQDVLKRAESVAEEAARHQGSARAALLTEFMANVSDSMQATLRHLNSTLAVTVV